jgi:heat shock protein HslJ
MENKERKMKTIPYLAAVLAAALLLSACASPAGNANSIPGSKWELTSLNGAAPIKGTSLTLFFGNDDKAAGNAGCNNFSGTYQVSGSSLTFGQMVSTMMACDPAVNAQEQAYLKALGETKSYEATTDKLTLKDGSSNVLAVFAPYQASSLAGSWQALAINNGKQAVVSVANGTTVTAVFGTDGTLTGNDGCNNYNSTYKTDGNKITIGAVSTTRMACEQAVMDQETAYLNALANAATYTTGKGTLELRDTSGALLVDYIAK